MPYPKGLKGPLNRETVVITGWSMLTNYASKTRSLYRHQWEMWYNGIEDALSALKVKGGNLDDSRMSNGQEVHPEYIYDFVTGQGRAISAEDMA